MMVMLSGLTPSLLCMWEDTSSRWLPAAGWLADGGILVTATTLGDSYVCGVQLVVCCGARDCDDLVSKFETAGRDGRPATALLAMSEAEARRKLCDLVQYGFLGACRRRALYTVATRTAHQRCGYGDNRCDTTARRRRA